jgi:hypothetical protein
MTSARRLLGLTLVLLVAATLPGFGQDDKGKSKAKPLTEDGLIKLAKADLEDAVIVAVVKERGVSFKVDDATVRRLKKAGVSETVLAALGPAGDDTKAADDPKPEANDGKPLATAKQDDGLIVEVLEVKPTKNETLLIRWRYRNPTRRAIELIAATPRFATRSSPPNTVTKFWKSVHYIEGRFQTGQAYDQYILVEDAPRNEYVPCAKKLGVDAVVIRPDQEFELYAEFPLPHSKSEKSISLAMLRTPLIKNIPIQKPDK